jgi:hypothetical protein
MQASRERVFAAAESLRETAELGMLFEHKNTAGHASPAAAAAKSIDPGTDDNCVESALIRLHALAAIVLSAAQPPN